MISVENDSPQVRIPPPLSLLALLIACYLLRTFLPAPFLPQTLSWILGFTVFTAGALLMFRAVILFRKHKTNIEPWRETFRIIKEGPYRFSRNPIYLSFLIIGFGAVLLANNIWALFLIPLHFAFHQFYVIPKEERYLQRKFGEEYRL